MPTFYFHVHNGDGVASDAEGSELPHLAAARDRALDGIRSILSDEVRQGSLDLAGRIEIADDSGAILMVVEFEEALAIQRGGGPA